MGVDGGHPRGADGQVQQMGAPRNIKIGDTTQIDERNIINVKKVSFLDTLPNINLNIDEVGPNTVGPNTVGPNTVGPNTVGPSVVGPNATISFIDKLKKKDTSEDLNFIKAELMGIKTEFGSLKTEFGSLKTEFGSLKTDLLTITTNNKLMLEQQEKIIDMLDRMTFNMGSI